MSIGAITDGHEAAERPVPGRRPCVHCFRLHPAPPHVRVVCPACREIEAALNGGQPPKVQVALGVARPTGLQPWWTEAEDRVLALCQTAAEAHGRLPWRSQVACSYRFKTLRRAGRLRAFDHRCWSPAEDARVAHITSGTEIPAVARALGRTVNAVHRRRGELHRAGGRVTRLRRAREAEIEALHGAPNDQRNSTGEEVGSTSSAVASVPSRRLVLSGK